MTMKKVTIFCVNYNSYKELDDYLRSIDVAAQQVTTTCRVSVWIADNTEYNFQKISVDYKSIMCRVFPIHENKGYLGGIFYMLSVMAKQEGLDEDFFVFSNVDLMLKMNFFEELLKCTDGDVAWIAPKIMTESTGKNENPYMIFRPLKLKIDLLRLLYRLPLFYALYSQFSKMKNKKKNKVQLFNRQEIYAGHGSIMIFSRWFVEKNFPFVFPAFMYGEEIYFAELVKKMGLRVMYEPMVEVSNVGNVSTKLLGNRKRCKMSYDALTQMRQYFK